MISAIRLFMYYLLAVTLGLTVLGLWIPEFNLLFFGKLTMIMAALFYAADYMHIRTLKEMINKFTEA